jgi:two-component system phosphate regulon sensor histidine kinase PhoR
MANRKGLKFIIDMSPEIGEVQAECDKRLIRIALEHLIANAIEFTSSGQVTVNCQMHGDSLKITIEDTGEGIPQDQLDRICERFYQVGSPEGRDARGAGLGLSIVKHVVDAHDQKLEVESIYGVGSRFGFRLKLAESRPKES